MHNRLAIAINALKGAYYIYYDLGKETDEELDKIIARLEEMRKEWIQKWASANPNKKYPDPETVLSSPLDTLYGEGYAAPYSFGGKYYDQIPKELAIKVFKEQFGEDCEIHEYEGDNSYIVDGHALAIWTPFDWYMHCSTSRLKSPNFKPDTLIQYIVKLGDFQEFYLTEED